MIHSSFCWSLKNTGVWHGPAFSLRSILVPERCIVLRTGEVAVGQPDRGPGIGRIAAGLLEELAKVARCLLWALTGVRDSGSFPLENHLLYPKETP